MSTKTALGGVSRRRGTRNTVKESIPVEAPTSSILFAPALKKHIRKPATHGLRRKTAVQSTMQPDFAAKLQSVAQGGLLSRLFSWFRTHVGTGSSKELRLAETVQLGEKRFVAIIHVEGRKFLIGGGTDGVNLLTQLDEPA